jgi:hypothetical protein
MLENYFIHWINVSLFAILKKKNMHVNKQFR